MIDIKCPFRFRSGRKWHCSAKKGNLKRREVYLTECLGCDYRRMMDAAAAIQNR